MKRHTQRSAPPRSARLALATALVLGSLAATAQAQQADPLAGIQWHLLNTGQTVPADTLPVAGNDLNVDGLFRNGIRGQGVTIAIVDDGRPPFYHTCTSPIRVIGVQQLVISPRDGGALGGIHGRTSGFSDRRRAPARHPLEQPARFSHCAQRSAIS